MLVHRVGQPYETFETALREVLSTGEPGDDLSECFEVARLHQESVLLEERDDDLSYVLTALDGVRQHRRAWAFGRDPADTEVLTDRLQDIPVPVMLVHVKGRVDLPAKAAQGVSLVLVQRHAETTLPVHEANDPGRFEHDPRCFLLIVPTRHIVTAGRTSS